MKKLIILALINTALACPLASANNVPNPLINIEVELGINKSSSGLFTYEYTAKNSSVNSEDIQIIQIFLGQNTTDKKQNLSSLPKCTNYLRHSSDTIFNENPVTATGSKAPTGWFCGYATLSGFSEVSYGWTAGDESHPIKPGVSLNGFSLTSYGLPTIRKILVAPYVDVDLLPREYENNVTKTIELENKVRWMGKTVGPKDPPKIFVATDFLNYIISLKDQSLALGWIKGSNLENQLNRYFTKAQKSLTKSDIKSVRKIWKKSFHLAKRIRADGIGVMTN